MTGQSGPINRVRMELEVEFVRTEKIIFEADLDDGLGIDKVPTLPGRLLRQIQFHMHHAKDLVKGERPRLVGWRLLDTECVCAAYPSGGGERHQHIIREGFSHWGRCSLCPCTYEPQVAATDV